MSNVSDTLKKPAWSLLTRVLLVTCLVVSCLIAWGMPFPNEDLFLGFCSGKATLNGHLATADHWAFTVEGRVWVDQSWLSHVVYYVSFLKFSYLGPVLIKGVLLIISVLILFTTCKALVAVPEISLLSVTLGVLALAPFLKIRGENFGMLLFVIMASILSLSTPRTRLRQMGALAVLAIWSNCHGSFMLGFFLIVLRFGIDAINAARQALSRRRDPPEAHVSPEQEEYGHARLGASLNIEDQLANAERSHDVLGWAVTLVIAVAIMGFANPYGTENLIIPFRQIGEKTVTAQWVDWRPLIHWNTIFTRGVFKSVSVLPFLSFTGITAGLMVLLVATTGPRRSLSLMFKRPSRIDPVMVVLIPLVLAPLVFRFQRMIIFAAPAMVPLVALLIHACAASWESQHQRADDPVEPSRGEPFNAVLACVFLIMLSFVFYKSVLIRHLPGNPLTYQEHDPPLLSSLMSRNFMRPGAVRFLNDNHITGRVFTNVYLTGYLLFYVPDIQFYFDLRVQSIFPEKVVKNYLSVVSSSGRDIQPTIDLLNRNRIDLVILDTSKTVNTRLANRLMQTQRWGCIYVDDWVIILADASSPRFGPMIRACNLDDLTYVRPETKTLALALLSLFTRGNIPPDILARLIAGVKKHPRPEVYSLIVAAMNGSSPCLNSRTRTFLESEASRLSKSNYVVSGGAFSILRSRLNILALLESNEIRCVANGRPERYTKQRRALTAAFEDLRKKYGGF